MDNPQTWRDLLATIISDPQERRRIASELGVNQVTLTRWINGDVKPRYQLLQKLLNALPDHREQLTLAIVQAFPDFSATIAVKETLPGELPGGFYSRILRTIADLSPFLHFWTLCDLILRQLLEQVDPYRSGMSVVLAQCMPPANGKKVRSLREVVGRGTPPWNRELEQKAIFLGMESLAGYALTTRHQHYEADLTKEGSRLPAKVTAGERSTVVTPIMRHGRVAGVLIVSSTQPDYFAGPGLSLLQQFADLLMLVFEPEEFYEIERVELGLMPSEEVQVPYLSTFRQRVNAKLLETSPPMSVTEAEQWVWSQLEEELLQLARSTGKPNLASSFSMLPEITHFV